MLRIKATIWSIVCGVAIQALLGSAIALADNRKSIVVVKSNDNKYFSQTIKTLISHTGPAASIEVINLGSSDSKAKLLEESDLVITLGNEASEYFSRQFPDKPIISAYLTLQQWHDLESPGKRHIAVLLDQPLERYLLFSHYLLQPRSIGIVNFSPLEINTRQSNTLSKLQLKLSQYQLDRVDKLLPKIRQLAQNDDALLMLPNQEIYNRHTLKGILLTSYRKSTPVISYSPAHVKSGALASIYSSPDDIGKHLGILLNRFLSEELRFENTPQFAKYYSIITNDRVAHSLGFKLPDASEMRRKMTEIVE